MEKQPVLKRVEKESRKVLDEKLEHIKHKQGYTSDTDLTVDELKELVEGPKQ